VTVSSAEDAEAEAEVVARCVRLPRPVRVAYEAGPTGFGPARALLAAGVWCVIAAPRKIERPAQDKIKADRRDAERLVRLLMIDGLHGVRVPRSPSNRAFHRPSSRRVRCHAAAGRGAQTDMRYPALAYPPEAPRQHRPPPALRTTAANHPPQCDDHACGRDKPPSVNARLRRALIRATRSPSSGWRGCTPCSSGRDRRW
jgi:hypothetical protein